MITVCPSCALALNVTAADLRAGQGFVRCSGCDVLFSALPTLREPDEPVPPFSHAVSPALLQPFDPAAIDVTAAEGADLEFDPSRADVASVFVEPRGGIIVVDAPGDVTVVDVRSEQGAANDGAPPEGEPAEDVTQPEPVQPDLPDTDAAGPFEAIENVEVVEVVAAPGPDSAPDSEPVAEPAAEPVAEPAAEPVAEPAADSTADSAADSTAEPDLSAFGTDRAPPPAWHRPALRWGSAGLVLLLAVQALNHWRHDLATNPRFFAPLKAVYDTIGVPLVPRWNVQAYEVRQLGAFASASGDGQLAVRMSILNRAPIPQPAPVLRVNVQDRYGNTVATRDVPPAAYVPAALRGSGFLQAGQRLDAEVRFLDPGRAAIGFEIDACVPAPTAGLVCASGTP